jgi:transposase
MIFVEKTSTVTKGVGVHISSLVKKLLNVKDILVKDVRFESKKGEEILVVAANPPKRKRHRCGICNRKSDGYDSGGGPRRWRSPDLGTTMVYIEAPAPRVNCKEHGVVAAAVPWARHKSRFTYGFEDMTAWLMLHSSRAVVSELMRIAWNTAGDIAKRVYDTVKPRDMFDGLVKIGIDETSYKKGHKYMTVIVDHESGRLIWAAKGHGKAVLSEFFEGLTEERRASIKYVTADGARWIADCIKTYCPNAERCIDPFHVVGWATEALDEVRRDAWREARKEASGEKRKAGSADKERRHKPKKGEGSSLKGKAEGIKGSRYALLKNPESLTGNQEATVEMIAISNPKLYRAYLLKEKLRLIFRLSAEEAAKEVTAWISWARRCRIPGFVELQRKIKRHLDAIIATISNGLSNARVEAMNNKIKLTVRMGYGFRNIDNLIALVMLRCSKPDLRLPGRT